MSVHFVFSDEVGDYHTYPTQKFLRANPYFIRVGVVIKGEDWPMLRDFFNELQLPSDCELKWSYICSIIAQRKRGEVIPKDREYAPLSAYSNEELISFVSDTVSLLRRCESCFIVYTVTDNSRVQGIPQGDIYKWHIQDLMQRTEYELQNISGLAVMFLDPKDRASNTAVQNAYASIYHDGDFVRKYLHITDSLSFALSNHSFGIRFADYAAGIFNNFIRGYVISKELFVNYLWPLVRKNPVGNPLGWGICEVPTNSDVRSDMRKRLVDMGFLPVIDKKQVLF